LRVSDGCPCGDCRGGLLSEIIEPLARESADRFCSVSATRTCTSSTPTAIWVARTSAIDGIIVMRARSCPAPLIEQLKPGGRMVILLANRTASRCFWLWRNPQRKNLHAQRYSRVICAADAGTVQLKRRILREERLQNQHPRAIIRIPSSQRKAESTRIRRVN